jgi:hypothetical protein
MPFSDEEMEHIRQELRDLKKIIAGDPYDREDRGILGDIQMIRQAIFGTKEAPGGMLSQLAEIRVTTRTIIVGLVVTVGGGLALRLFAGG